jgi:penicillin-binding protein 1A
MQGKSDHLKPVEVGDAKLVNRVKRRRVLPASISGEVASILQTVVGQGTGVDAQIPGVVIAGKTGTTEDYGDAWFVGWTKEYTVAVWVGYPDKFQPMRTEFRGQPVAGGTFPANIWKTFMQSLLKMYPLPQDEGGDGTGIPSPTPGGTTPPSTGTAPAPTAAPTTAPAAPTAAPTTAPPAPTAAPTTAPPEPTTPPAPTPGAGTGGTGAATTGTG